MILAVACAFLTLIALGLAVIWTCGAFAFAETGQSDNARDCRRRAGAAAIVAVGFACVCVGVIQ